MVEPKKAGSLILAKQVDSLSENDYYDYQILFLTRKKGMTFSSAVAFPGGKIESSDVDFITKNAKALGLDLQDKHAFLNYLFRISALRETYEETGLFVGPSGLDKQKLKALLESHQGSKTHIEFYSLVNELGLSIGEELTEFLRFVTPSQIKYRFDAQFFVCKTTSSGTINVPTGLKDFSKIGETNTLEINMQESDQFLWLNPMKAMAGHLSKTFELGPPQVVMINILMSFKKFDDMQKYLKEIKAEAKKNKSEDLFQTNPLTFPMIPYFGKNDDEDQELVKKGYGLKFILPPDAEYPIQKVIESEKVEKVKEEIRAIYTKLQNKPTNRCRLYLTKDVLKGPSIGKVNLSIRVPIEAMKGTSAFDVPILKGTL